MLRFDRDAAVAMYESGKSPHHVAKQFGVHHKVISREIRSRGIEPRNQIAYRRRYTVNEHFFDVIDTEEKAYWLGFITADGNVSKAQLRIALQRGDRLHLEKFAIAISSNAPIHDNVSKTPDGKPSLQSYIIVCSRPMVTSLYNCGIVENKSLVVQPFGIEHFLSLHYWRGLVDGDGWIAKHKNGKVTLGLCGSEKICKGFRLYASSLGLNANLRLRKNTWSSEITTTKESLIMYKHLYTDANINLDRKREMFQ